MQEILHSLLNAYLDHLCNMVALQQIQLLKWTEIYIGLQNPHKERQQSAKQVTLMLNK